MAEATTSITRVDIKLALRRYLQYARTGSLETDQEADLDAMVKFGENAFYGGMVLPGEAVVHQWSFLNAEYSLSVLADDYAYDLPDLWGGFVDSYLTYSVTDNALEKVQIVEYEHFQDIKSSALTISADFPTHATTALKTIAQSTGQRFQLYLWPTPSSNCTLNGRYRLNPALTTDGAPYPLGGQPHGLTLLEACLAAAELHMNDEANGPHKQEFMQRYAASVALDRARTTPPHFGKNLDRSRWEGRPYRRHLAQGIEYLGSS